MKPRIEASLTITGSGTDPKLCTELLKVNPDTQWRKGEPYMSVVGRIYKRYSGFWDYSTKNRVLNDDPYNPVPHVNHLIKIFSGKKAQFDKIRSCMEDVSVKLIIWWEVSHGTYTLDKRLLERILEMGVDDIDYTFIGIDEEEEKKFEEEEVEIWCDGVEVKLSNQSNADVLLEVDGAISKVGAGLWSRIHQHTPIENRFEIILHSPSLKRHETYAIDIPQFTSYFIILTLSETWELTGSMIAPSATNGGTMMPISVQPLTTHRP